MSSFKGFLSRLSSFFVRCGLVLVVGAGCFALATLLIFGGYTPIIPTERVILFIFLTNVGMIFLLLCLLASEAFLLYRAWQKEEAGARAHLQIAGLFSLIAAAPAILLTATGTITIERALNPAFIQDVRGFIGNTAQAAALFRESQCISLIQEARLTAADLDRGKTMYETDRALFHDFFGSRVRFLNFSMGVLLTKDGKVIEHVDNGGGSSITRPAPSDFEEALRHSQECLITDGGLTFVALQPMQAFPDTFLYAARKVNPLTIAFPIQAEQLISSYDQYEAQRRNIQFAFGILYAFVAVILVLCATWLGLAFSRRLVDPIRRLIAATDQVATGNFYVQVPLSQSRGDLAHLAKTFNKMTSELRIQKNSLIAANILMDERRNFIQTVLAAVPVAVLGSDAGGKLTVMNPSAERLFGCEATYVMGKPIQEVLPELDHLLQEATREPSDHSYRQKSLTTRGREHIVNIYVQALDKRAENRSFVVTLDDITDLVTAQRMSAWADVARRIAHEIKNPLTPIQLSAERLRRKYGKVIIQDKDIFDRCIETIVRQVDDIQKMVDEFSSFARMPKAHLEEGDLMECIRQVLFLTRVGYPQIDFVEQLPVEPLRIPFDRRLFSQALTNVLKNATEGISADETPDRPLGKIMLVLAQDPGNCVTIDIIDNGKGFPKDHRYRLLEPYITTRAEGSGLGLPIVAKILEDHGGRIELLDAPGGKGACVRLILPLLIPKREGEAEDGD